MCKERLLILTGRLAEPSVLRAVHELAANDSTFRIQVQVLPITVAALMHSDWIRKKLTIDSEFDRVLLPGWCTGNVADLTAAYAVPFEIGPKNIANLSAYLSGKDTAPPKLEEYDIEIIAEINHAPRLSSGDILEQAIRFGKSGADLIDIGCIPGEPWSEVGQATRMLVEEGFRVSVDSFDREEAEAAVGAGAELVLSCNSTNIDWAEQLDVEFVVIPDEPSEWESMEQTIARMQKAERSFRIDPILEPIGFGFAASLERYFLARKKWPELPMMMGIGNLTELTEVDSAGINMLFAAICQELKIGSVLTTEVINWARTSVREFDFARRLVKHSLDEKTLPKHLDSSLVMLRDPKLSEIPLTDLELLAKSIKDGNYRIFVSGGEIHLMNRNGHWRGTDPFEITKRAFAEDEKLKTAHAFYLGYEMNKAKLALILGKQYTQDEELDWGMLS